AVGAVLTGIVYPQYAMPGFIVILSGDHDFSVRREHAMAEEMPFWRRLQCLRRLFTFKIKSNGKETGLPAKHHGAATSGIDSKAVASIRHGNKQLLTPLRINNCRLKST